MPTATNKCFTVHRKLSGDPFVKSRPDRAAIQSRLNELRHELDQVNRMIRVLEWARDKPAATR